MRETDLKKLSARGGHLIVFFRLDERKKINTELRVYVQFADILSDSQRLSPSLEIAHIPVSFRHWHDIEVKDWCTLRQSAELYGPNFDIGSESANKGISFRQAKLSIARTTGFLFKVDTFVELEHEGEKIEIHTITQLKFKGVLYYPEQIESPFELVEPSAFSEPEYCSMDRWAMRPLIGK